MFEKGKRYHKLWIIQAESLSFTHDQFSTKKLHAYFSVTCLVMKLCTRTDRFLIIQMLFFYIKTKKQKEEICIYKI
jgi:hypothetical protein